MKNGDYKLSVEARLTCVETKLQEIISNHLPHLATEVREINQRVWWILGTVIIGFVIQIVLKL